MAKPPRAPVNKARSIMLMLGMVLLMGMGYLAFKLKGGIHGSTEPPRKQLLGIRYEQPPPVRLTSTSLRLVAKALDPEVMQHALPEGTNFSPQFKNPCWEVKDGLRCLPYVYILGGFQSGANTLFGKLSEHPDIVTNDVSRWQFWAEDGKTMAGYIDKHSTASTLKAIQAGPKTKVLLDGSASTFAFYWSAGLRAHRAFQSVMVPCWRDCSEASKGKKELLRNCTAEKCYSRSMAADIKVAESLNVTYDELHLPLLMSAAYGGSFKPKLIMMIRNPVDRVHCAYWQYPHYQNKYGKSAIGFLAYVKEQVGSLKACAERFVGQLGGTGKRMDLASAERHCGLYFEALGNDEEQIFFHVDQFMRGMYSIYVDVWLRHFPRESVLVVRSEKYFANEEATLKQVFNFLGLSDLTPEQLQKMSRAGKPNPCTRNAPQMLPEAEQILRDLYKPYNDHLAELLHDPQWLEYNKPGVSARTEATALLL